MKSRKDLIKNISIIFLAIMLVLTFFSNTIMNWSLPQVSGRYTEYGEIKTGVRGSGSVVSNMTYTETVKGNRTVEAVYVNRGSEVQKGDLLMLMSPTETDGIKTLESEISTMQEAYDRALLGKTENDYSADEMSIRNAEEDLAELKEERAVYTDEYIAEVKKAAEDADIALENSEAKVEELEERLEEISESSDAPEIVAARAEVDKKQASYDLAVEAVKKANEALEGAEYVDVTSMESQLTSYREQVSSLKTELRYINEDYAEVFSIAAAYNTKESEFKKAENAYNTAKKKYEEDTSELPDEEKDTYKAMVEAEQKLNDARTAFAEAEALYNENLDEIKAGKRSVEQKNNAITAVEDEIYYLRIAVSQAKEGNREYNGYKNMLDLRLAEEEAAKKALDEATTALENEVKRQNKEITDELKVANKLLEAAIEVKTEADKKLDGLSVIESLDEQIKSSERSLESMKLSLEKRKESDTNADKIEQYDLNKQYQAIQDKKKELAELKGESKEGYELRATHAGVITEVNFKAGEIAAEGSAAVVIEVQESGYTLSFSVSNAEAAKVKEGDIAQVSDTYWGQNVGAVLKKIIPDAGGKTKTLTFELDGNVNVGQTLTLLVGERSTAYSSVIPKSALHEDSKGKFVYVTKTKSTPLGNRYVATRLDVRIAAEDDKNVAIVTDETYLYEYVIVSSTKPFEDGGYVRLSD